MRVIGQRECSTRPSVTLSGEAEMDSDWKVRIFFSAFRIAAWWVLEAWSSISGELGAGPDYSTLSRPAKSVRRTTVQDGSFLKERTLITRHLKQNDIPSTSRENSRYSQFWQGGGFSTWNRALASRPITDTACSLPIMADCSIF